MHWVLFPCWDLVVPSVGLSRSQRGTDQLHGLKKKGTRYDSGALLCYMYFSPYLVAFSNCSINHLFCSSIVMWLLSRSRASSA